MSALRVAIIGAGIGGLVAANALQRKGVGVTVYEQAGRPGDVGAGVLLSRSSLTLLDRHGLAEPLRQVGAPVDAIALRDAAGAPIATTSTGSSLGIYRPDIVSVLADSLPEACLHAGRRCVAFSQDNGCATVEFDDGEPARADVVIAADGIRSTLQQYVVARNDPVFSGLVAYRGVLPSSRLFDQKRHIGTGWVGNGRSFLTYPPFHNGQLTNWVGIVPSSDKMDEIWSAPGDPADLAREFANWDPTLTNIIDQVDTTFCWGLYDRDPLPRWTNGRLALLGDAAHAMLPQVGQGANQAIEDGIALATLLAGLDSADAPEALRRYESLRRPRVAMYQAAGRAHRELYDDEVPPDHARHRAALSRLQSEEYDVEAEAQNLR